MPSEERNRIEDLKQSIYSRNAPEIRTRRRMHVSTQDTELKKDWDHPKEVPEEDPVLNSEYEEQKKGMSFVTKFLIGSVVFCMLAIGAGAYIFFNGGNFISGNNIDVHIGGPVSVPGGTPVTLSITITNNNAVALKNATLNVHFPAGSTDPNDTTSLLQDHREDLGDLAPGASVTKSVEAVIFGEENAQKQVSATVTYGINGSSSTFTKDISYDLVVNSSPVVVSVSSVKETTSGQPFDMAVTVKSNSSNPLKGVLLKATYPFGYTYGSASIKPASPDNATWSLGDMPAGSTKTITIHGTLTGEDTELRAFHFTVGAKSPNNPVAIGTAYTEGEQDVTIQKPYVTLTYSIDNDSDAGDHVGTFGRSENINLKWKNNLPETLSNAVITVHLSGSAYNKNYVSAFTGFFKSATDDIIWNQQTNPELGSIPSGASGVLTFGITPTNNSATSQIVNPSLTLSASIQSNRTSGSNVQVATAPVTRTIKITSNVSLSGRVVRSSGPFVNLGPIPPVAEQKTTYTIVWDVDNTSNSVSNSVVTATLPPYVTWLNQVSPTSEDVSYDKNSGTITWNVGNVNSFTYGTSQRRELFFQVAIQPSVDQINSSPIILNQSTLSGIDTWTKAQVQSVQGYLTTSFSTDPSFKAGDGVVQHN